MGGHIATQISPQTDKQIKTINFINLLILPCKRCSAWLCGFNGEPADAVKFNAGIGGSPLIHYFPHYFLPLGKFKTR